MLEATHRSTTCGRPGLLAIVLVLSVFSHPMHAAVIVVDGADSVVADNGECSLREAITAANTDSPSGGTPGECAAGLGADELLLARAVTLDTVDHSFSGPNGLPAVTSEIAIRGLNGHVAIQRSPAAPDFRLVHVANTGSLVLERVVLSEGQPGGFNTGGAILNLGTLSLIDSTVTANSAYQGGGLSNDSIGASVTIADSTISGNSAGYRGGGLINYTYGTVTLSNSTISDNDAFRGGGVFAYFGMVTLTNSTLSGNLATTSGGGANADFGRVNLINSTVSGNSGTNGANVYGYADLTLSGSVIGNPVGGDNCAGPGIADGGGNLADDGSCDSVPGTLTGLDSTLTSNGGPTPTHALLADSTAIDAANACGLVTDQRGLARVGSCDSGAFERGALPAEPEVGGALTGTSGRRVRCTNLATGQEVEFQLSGATSWSCEDKGLIVGPGDPVTQVVAGRAD